MCGRYVVCGLYEPGVYEPLVVLIHCWKHFQVTSLTGRSPLFSLGFFYPFVHLFNKCLLRVHYLSGLVLRTRDVALSKRRQGLCPEGAYHSVVDAQ